MKAIGALGAVFSVGFGVCMGITTSSSLAPGPGPGPSLTSTQSIEITTVAGATEVTSFSEVRTTIYLPRVAEPSSLLESLHQPPSKRRNQ